MPRKGYRKPLHEARSHRTQVWLNDAEISHLRRCVDASNVGGTSDFIRRRIMGFEIKRPPSDTKLKLIHELAMLNRALAILNNNMNQLARAANSGRGEPIWQLVEELSLLQRVRQQAADVLNQMAGLR